MPDAVRLKVGRVTPHQMQVYEDFGRHIPGFATPPDAEVTSAAAAASVAVAVAVNPLVPKVVPVVCVGNKRSFVWRLGVMDVL